MCTFQEEEMIRLFLDRMLKSRLGIRLLVEHHLALHDEKVIKGKKLWLKKLPVYSHSNHESKIHTTYYEI